MIITIKYGKMSKVVTCKDSLNKTLNSVSDTVSFKEIKTKGFYIKYILLY